MSDVRWIECGPEHLEPIRAIFNDAILTSTALYEYEPRSAEVMQAWWQARQQAQLPVIGAVNAAGELMGFASYGPFRPHAAYHYTVEHSVYVDARFRGLGLGEELLQRLIQRAQQQDYHVLIGVIDAQNEPSIALHRKLGFEPCGHLRETGYKFDRWLDLSLWQLVLTTPEKPVAKLRDSH
jgi:L-amino acid N-acyltransferase